MKYPSVYFCIPKTAQNKKSSNRRVPLCTYKIYKKKSIYLQHITKLFSKNRRIFHLSVLFLHSGNGSRWRQFVVLVAQLNLVNKNS